MAAMFAAMEQGGRGPRRGDRRDGERRRARHAVPGRELRPRDRGRGAGAHPATTCRRCAEIVRVLKPGGHLAVTVPSFLPERICWALSEDYHTAPGGHVRIYTLRRAEGQAQGRRAARRPAPPRPRAALAVLVDQVRGRGEQRRPPARQGVPRAARLGHHEAPRRHPDRRAAAQPADRQERGRVRRGSPRDRPDRVADRVAAARARGARRARRRAGRADRRSIAAHAGAGRRRSPGRDGPRGRVEPRRVPRWRSPSPGSPSRPAGATSGWYGTSATDGSWPMKLVRGEAVEHGRGVQPRRLHRGRRLARAARHRRRGLRPGDVADGDAGRSTSSSTCRPRAARSSGSVRRAAARPTTRCSPAAPRSTRACAAASRSPSASATRSRTGSSPPTGSAT